MAITTMGQRVLGEYVMRAQASGVPEIITINMAVKLTVQQQSDIQRLLIGLWKRPTYICPPNLPIKPRHGYNSRVINDGFTGQQYIDWLVAGCSDAAVAGAKPGGFRIFLGFGPMGDYPNITYNLEVPIHSDAFGRVHIDDVIPKGLQPGTMKCSLVKP